MSRIKLVAVDLDGTLIDEEGRISERSAAAIRRATEQGITVAIVTGRPHVSAERFVAELGIDATPIISFNGAMVRMPGDRQALFHLPLGAQEAGQILQRCVQRRLVPLCFVGDELWVTRVDKWARLYYSRTDIRPIPRGDLRRLLPFEPTKIIVMDEPERVPGIYEEMARELGERVYVTISRPEMVEFMHKDANKGRALGWLAERLGASLEETLAIGDSLNDVPLLEAAGVAVAPPGADERAKAAADWVAESQADCVAEAIEKFVFGRG